MNDAYRQPCERCRDLEEKLKEVDEQNEAYRAMNHSLRVKTWWQRALQSTVIAVVLGGATMGGILLHARCSRAPAQEPCVESTVIITPQNSMKECAPGASIETEVLKGEEKGNVLVKCRCLAEKKDAGEP